MTAFKKVRKSEAGAKPKLTEELIQRICNTLRAGAYIETAVVVNGISKQTFYGWCKLANEKIPISEHDIYRQFLDAVERAMEEATVRDLLNIDKAAMGTPQEYERYPDGSVDDLGRDISGHVMLDGKGNPIVKIFGQRPDWSASAWRLERRRPKEWSRTEKQEVSIKENNIQVEFVDSPEDEK